MLMFKYDGLVYPPEPTGAWYIDVGGYMYIKLKLGGMHIWIDEDDFVEVNNCDSNT